MTGHRFTAVVGACAAVVSACGGRHLPPPPPAPVVVAPREAIPGDLDAVVRVDLDRMLEALGDAVVQEVEGRVGGGVPAAGGDPLVAAAVRHADTAWFAFRPGFAPELTDNVLVLRGEFSDVRVASFEADPPWEIGQDLGGGWRRLDRATPAVRAAPARIYRYLDELLVLVSEAEIDATELVLERGAEVERVEAPNEGAVSAAIRAPTLAAVVNERAPAAARLLARARVVSAQIDLPGRGLTGEIEVVFREPASAEQAAEATRLLGAALREQGGLEGAIVERLDVSATGRSLVVRLDLDERDLAVISAVLR
jgi:hypothetical protein